MDPQNTPQLDPTALTLSRAIRSAEGGDYTNSSGDGGTSAGAYQWNNFVGGKSTKLNPGQVPSNFQSAASQFGLDPSDFSQTNQDHVAYEQIKAQLDAGHSQSEVASWWNSGSYNPAGKVGYNATIGSSYDTPAYVAKVQKYYQQQMQSPSGGSPLTPPPGSAAPAGALPGYSAPTPPPPLSASTQQSQQQPESLGGKALDVAKGIGNFFFPAVGDVYNDITGNNKKTALQQAGDVGLSALPFIPGLGEVGEAARGAEAGAEGAGLLGKLAGSSIAKNAAVGYGAGVASNLSGGQGIGQALTPQLSNIGGAVLGGGTAAIFNKLAASNADSAVISKLQSIYDDALGATKTGIKAGSKVEARGTESPASFLANAGIAPETEEVNGRTVFKTGEDSNTYKTIQSRADALTQLRDNLIDSSSNEDLGDGMSLEKSNSSLGDLRTAALAQAQTQFFGKERAQAIGHINDEFDALESQLGGDQVPLSGLNTVKKYFQSNTNYDATRPSTITQANKMVAALARSQVEKDAEAAGVPGIGPLNKIIQQHLDFLNTGGGKGILDKLNGQTVKGGRIGNYVKETIGGAAGAAASASVGGGPIGDILGAVGGAVAGNKISRLMQRFSVGGSGMSGRIGKIAQEDPQLIQQLIQVLKERGKETEGLVSPRLAPAAKKMTGLVPSLVTKGAARVGAAL